MQLDEWSMGGKKKNPGAGYGGKLLACEGEISLAGARAPTFKSVSLPLVLRVSLYYGGSNLFQWLVMGPNKPF